MYCTLTYWLHRAVRKLQRRPALGWREWRRCWFYWDSTSCLVGDETRWAVKVVVCIGLCIWLLDFIFDLLALWLEQGGWAWIGI